MNRTWLYIQADEASDTQKQENALRTYCCKNNLMVVGLTVGNKSDHRIDAAVTSAKENDCTIIVVDTKEELTHCEKSLAVLLDAYCTDGIRFHSPDTGEFLKVILDFEPRIKYLYAPAEWFSIDDLLEEDENPEYPVKRSLDDFSVRLQRLGQVQRVCITDLCEDEMIRVLDTMTWSEMKSLCRILATNLRHIGDLLELYRDENRSYYTTKVV